MTRDDHLRIEGYYVAMQVLRAAVESTLTAVEGDPDMTKGEACKVMRVCVDLEADFAAHQLVMTGAPNSVTGLRQLLQQRPKA